MTVSFYYPSGRLKYEVDTFRDPPVFATQRDIGGGGPLVETKKGLEDLGVETKLFDQWRPDHDFDVLYVDGSSYEVKEVIEVVKRLKKPIFTVPAAYSSRPEWQFKLWSILEPVLPLSTVYGLRKRIYELSNVVIPQSNSEAKQLASTFSLDRQNMEVIQLGISHDLFSDPNPQYFEEEYGIKDFVLQVGRINDRKGQIRLIDALDGLGIEVVFIGELHADQPDVVDQFMKMIEERSWAHYIGALPHDTMLASAYAAARVHALPSTYEFPGMVSLEAAAAGCAIVSGPYPTIKDYVGSMPFYCDPRDINSIRTNVKMAYDKGHKSDLKEYVLENYTWKKRSENLLNLFQRVL